MLLKGTSSIAQSLKSLSGPDDILGQAASKNPLGIIAADESGPYYIQDGAGSYKSTHLLACVELLTYQIFLIPLPKTDTCLLYTSPSPRDGLLSRMPSSA